MMKTKKLPLILTLICVWIVILGIAIDAYSPPAADSAKIAEQVSMTDGILGVQFYVEKGANVNAADLSLKVTYGDKTVTLTMPAKAEARESCYVFTFEGVLPHGMGNDISAALYIGESVIPADTVRGTSYADGLKAIYAASESATEQQLIVDILEYGAAAQTYTGYRTNALVTKDFAPAAEDEDLTPPDTDFVFSKGRVIDICSATVRFDSAVTFKVTYESDDESAVVNGQTVAVDSDNQGRKVVLYPVLPAHFYKKQDFGFLDGNYGRYTFQYSVNDYCYAMWENGSEGMKALARALYNYGLSAHLHRGVHDYSAGTCLACGDVCAHTELTGDTCDTCGTDVSYYGDCGTNVIWRLTSDGTLIISGEGAMEDYANVSPWLDYDDIDLTTVIIKEGVTSIGQYAFASCPKLASVTIPEGMNSIGDYAFAGCAALKSVILSEGVTSIGNHAFEYCISLPSVTIPASVKTVGDYAFFNCIALGSVTISEGVTAIGDYAFESCKSLTAVTIPASVETVGSYAFKGCTKLKSVTISEGVNSIGIAAFMSCESLITVTIPASVKTVGDSAFNSCTALESVTISEGVTAIGDAAFAYCEALTAVTIPASVKTVGDYAFAGCAALESVTISEGVTAIGDYAFEYCEALTAVTIPASVKTVGESAFEGCTALKTINVPCSRQETPLYTFGDGVTVNIAEHSFTDSVCTTCGTACEHPSYQDAACTVCGTACEHPSYNNGVCTVCGDYCAHETEYTWCTQCGLEILDAGNCGEDVIWRLDRQRNFVVSGTGSIANSVIYLNITHSEPQRLIIKEGITAIGSNTFDFPKTFLSAVSIPASVTSIGEGSFSLCDAITTFTVHEANPNYKVENNVLYTKDGRTLIHAFNVSGSFEIPAGVTTVGKDAFTSCKNMTALTIPESVTFVGYTAFYSCSSLTDVTVNMQSGSIDAYAFWDCPKLETVTLSAGVTAIGEGAFGLCDKLTTVNAPCNWDGSLYDFGDGVTVNIAKHSYADGACTVCGTADPAA